MTIKAVKLRWFVPGDWPEIMDIENSSFERPWLRIDFQRTASKQNTVFLVAECDCEVAGYMVYERLERMLVLQRLAVHWKYRRNGTATMLIQRLKDRIGDNSPKAIADVNEYWLGAQMLLSREGFVCTESMDDYYGDERDSVSFYRFEYTEGGNAN